MSGTPGSRGFRAVAACLFAMAPWLAFPQEAAPETERIPMVEGAIKGTVDSQRSGMERVIGEILETTKAPAAKKPALEEAAKKAVDAFEDRTRQQMAQVYRKLSSDAGGQAPGATQVYEAHWVVYREEKAGEQVPPEQTVWNEDLRRILSAEEWALWEAEILKRRELVEAGLEAYVKSSADKNVVERRSQMERRVNDLVMETNFPKEKVDALKTAVADVAERAREPSAAIAREFASIFARNAYLGMFPNVLDVFQAGSNRFPGMEKALGQVANVDLEAAVKAALAPEEYELWEKAKEESKLRVDKAIQEYLTRLKDARRQERQSGLERQVDRMVRGLSLEEARQQALRQGLDGVVDEGLKVWLKGQETAVRNFAKDSGNSEEEVLDYLEQGSVRFSSAAQGEDASSEQTEREAFEKLLASQLQPGELERWLRAESERTARRAQAMTMVIVSEVDRTARLTASQRAALEPLVHSVVSEYLPFVENEENFGYMLQNSEGLLVFLQGVPADKAKEIIQPGQQAAWDQALARYSGWWQNMEMMRNRAGGKKP